MNLHSIGGCVTQKDAVRLFWETIERCSGDRDYEEAQFCFQVYTIWSLIFLFSILPHINLLETFLEQKFLPYELILQSSTTTIACDDESNVFFVLVDGHDSRALFLPANSVLSLSLSFSERLTEQKLVLNLLTSNVCISDLWTCRSINFSASRNPLHNTLAYDVAITDMDGLWMPPHTYIHTSFWHLTPDISFHTFYFPQSISLGAKTHFR